MMISLIVAVGKNREIGLNNDLIWKISEDLQNFKKITMGHHLVLGRRTYESIGKSLTGRKLIVLTSDPYFQASGCKVATSIDEAIFYAKQAGEDELMVCGGAKVYKDFLSRAGKMYISRVDYEGEADTFFPEFDRDEWRLDKDVFYPEKTESKTPSWTFEILLRK